VPINGSYANDIFINFNDEITRYMYPKPAKEISETNGFITESIKGLKEGNNLQLVALKKPEMEFLGCIGLHHVGQKDPELGIWIKKAAHGYGYGLEAISAVIEWAEKNVEYEYLKYPVDRRNFASKRIPETTGGVQKKEYKKVNLKGFELDEIEYWIQKKKRAV
jgi:[ribosomal protein S5]-alanine N-acetyltransferase